jgi:two-component system cell cycle sensor histidine kinase/response regulator CckA
MAEATPPGRASTPTPTILFAEDQLPLRRTIASLLQHLGYRVIEAADGHDAIALFHQHAGEISVALLDLTMPGPSGLEVARLIRQQSPNLPIILSSGYDEQAHQGDQATVTAFLQKPYPMAELERILQRLLSTPEG